MTGAPESRTRSFRPTELSFVCVCGLKWVASLDSGNVHRDEFSSEVKVVVLVQLLPSEKKKRTDIYRAVIFQKIKHLRSHLHAEEEAETVRCEKEITHLCVVEMPETLTANHNCLALLTFSKWRQITNVFLFPEEISG